MNYGIYMYSMACHGYGLKLDFSFLLPLSALPIIQTPPALGILEEIILITT